MLSSPPWGTALREEGSDAARLLEVRALGQQGVPRRAFRAACLLGAAELAWAAKGGLLYAC